MVYSGEATRGHECNYTSVTRAVMNYLTRHPQLWARLPWACLNCGQENAGVDALCGRSACRDERGGHRAFVLGNILTKVGVELATLDEVVVSSAEIWPVHKVIEVLLSPHNRAFSALLTGAFRAPIPSENCCECCVTTYQPLISLRPRLAMPHSSSHTFHTTPLATTHSPASPSPSPAPAPLEGPLQAHSVDNTVKKDLDTSLTTHNTHSHPFIPHMAEEQALKEEAASTPAQRARG